MKVATTNSEVRSTLRLISKNTKLNIIKSIHTIIWLFFNTVIFYLYKPFRNSTYYIDLSPSHPGRLNKRFIHEKPNTRKILLKFDLLLN